MVEIKQGVDWLASEEKVKTTVNVRTFFFQSAKFLDQRLSNLTANFNGAPENT